jgi:hypothetical protein
MAQQNETDGEISTFTNCHLVTAVLAVTDSGWMATLRSWQGKGLFLHKHSVANLVAFGFLGSGYFIGG